MTSTIRTSIHGLGLTLSLLLSGACDTPASFIDEGANTALRPGSGGGGGIVVNTLTLGDQMIAEMSLAVPSQNGTVLETVEVKIDHEYIPLVNLYSVDGQLIGETANYGEVDGIEFTDSRWTVTTQSGPSVFIISQVEETWIDPVGVVWEYTLNNEIEAPPEELPPPCGHQIGIAPAEQNYKAVVLDRMTADEHGELEQVGDPNAFFLACESGAIGKAVTWGYSPVVPEISLDEFEATVRMIRADFCGDGESWTAQGTPLARYDELGIHQENIGTLEAVWTEFGALCVGDTTRLGVKFSNVPCSPPTCDGLEFEYLAHEEPAFAITFTPPAP